MYKNFELTNEERKQILEQHSSYGYRKPLNEQGQGMWYQKYGCIVDGIDGLKKITTDVGTEFEHTGPNGRTILYNDNYKKPNPELVKKVMDANPTIKLIGKGMNLTTQEEVVFYCTGPVRGGIKIIGKNDTVEPPKVYPTTGSTQTTGSTTTAPVNEQTKTKVFKLTEENLSLLINESMAQAQSAIADAKSKMSSGEKPDPSTMEEIKQCITNKQLTSLMFLTTGAGGFALGIIAMLIAGGPVTAGASSVVGMVAGGTLSVGSIITLFITGLSEKDGGLGANPAADVKALLSCMGV